MDRTPASPQGCHQAVGARHLRNHRRQRRGRGCRAGRQEVAKIRSDPAPEIDPFEAVKVVEQLSTAEVDDVVSEGDSFRVTTRVLGGSTSHVLNMPSAKDVFDYRRGFARVLDLPFGKQELTINISPAGVLYKKLVVSTEGYAGDVPIIHQAIAVKAAIDAMDNAFAEDRDANF